MINYHLGAVGELCPSGFETVEGSVAIPSGGITPTTVKKVAHGVQKAHLRKVLVERPLTKRTQITMFRILNPAQLRVKRSEIAAVLNGVRDRKSETFDNYL